MAHQGGGNLFYKKILCLGKPVNVSVIASSDSFFCHQKRKLIAVNPGHGAIIEEPMVTASSGIQEP